MTKLDSSLLGKTSLRDLSEDQIAALEACSYNATYKLGDFIFHRGKDSTSFFLVRSGRIHLELYTREQGPRLIQSLGMGEFMGTSWMVPPHKWRMDARAVEDSELIVFNGSKVNEECSRDPELGYALMRCFFIAMCQRLESSQNQLLALSSS